MEGDLFRARYLQALALFEGADKFARLDETIGSSRVEPRKAASHDLDRKLVPLEVNAIEIGDLEFTARRRLKLARNVDRLTVVEIEAGDRPVRAWVAWFLLDCRGTSRVVEADHSVA